MFLVCILCHPPTCVILFILFPTSFKTLSQKQRVSAGASYVVRGLCCRSVEIESEIVFNCVLSLPWFTSTGPLLGLKFSIVLCSVE